MSQICRTIRCSARRTASPTSRRSHVRSEYGFSCEEERAGGCSWVSGPIGSGGADGPDQACARSSMLSVTFVSHRKWRFAGNTARLARVDDLLMYSAGSCAAVDQCSEAFRMTTWG
jgi:hypothetical protein